MDAMSSEDFNNNCNTVDTHDNVDPCILIHTTSDEIPVIKSAFKFQFQFRINGIGLTKNHMNAKITSPLYKAHVPFNLLSWRLHVYPFGIDDKSKGYLSVQLELIANNTNGELNDALRQITFKVGILNHANRLISKSVQTNNFSERNVSFPMNFHKLPFFSTLKNECTAPLTNDTLILRCKVTYDESLLRRIVPPVDLNEIASMHQQEMLTDVTLRIFDSQEGDDDGREGEKIKFLMIEKDLSKCSHESYREIKAHKIILASRSSVFATMFSKGNYNEATNSLVDIRDVSFRATQQLIHFIYTGTVQDIDEEIAIELLYAGEKYDIASLKDTCVRYLSKHLSYEAAEHVEAIADSFNLHHLKHLARKVHLESLVSQ